MKIKLLIKLALLTVVYISSQSLSVQAEDTTTNKSNYHQIINYKSLPEFEFPDFILKFITVGSAHNPMTKEESLYPIFEIKSPDGLVNQVAITPLFTDYVPQLGSKIDFILDNQRYRMEITYSSSFNKILPEDSIIISKQPPEDTKFVQLSWSQFDMRYFPQFHGGDLGKASNLITIPELQHVQTFQKMAIEEFNFKQRQHWQIFLDNNPNRNINEFLIDLNNYRTQYAVGYNHQQEKIVILNCFRDRENSFPLWEQELVEVLDGGNDFFKVIVNLSQGTYQLKVNGHA